MSKRRCGLPATNDLGDRRRGDLRLFLPLADTIELTEVLEDVDGDTFLDDPRDRRLARGRGARIISADGRPPFRFVTLERA